MASIKRTVEDYLAKIDAFLNEENAVATVFAKLEEKTGIKRTRLAHGLIVFILIYLIVGYGASFLCCLIGFLYPAYASIKAIESKEKDDDTKWLTYWVVYGGFSLVEFFTDMFLFWFPLYYFIKCLFLVYCMVPTSWNGSVVIYYKVIRPHFLKYEKEIDESIDQVSSAGQKLITDAKDISEQVASEVAKKQLLEKND